MAPTQYSERGLLSSKARSSFILHHTYLVDFKREIGEGRGKHSVKAWTRYLPARGKEPGTNGRNHLKSPPLGLVPNFLPSNQTCPSNSGGRLPRTSCEKLWPSAHQFKKGLNFLMKCQKVSTLQTPLITRLYLLNLFSSFLFSYVQVERNLSSSSITPLYARGSILPPGRQVADPGVSRSRSYNFYTFYALFTHSHDHLFDLPILLYHTLSSL